MTPTDSRLTVAAIQGLSRAIASHGYNIECAAGHFSDKTRGTRKLAEARALLADLQTDIHALNEAFARFGAGVGESQP